MISIRRRNDVEEKDRGPDTLRWTSEGKRMGLTLPRGQDTEFLETA